MAMKYHSLYNIAENMGPSDTDPTCSYGLLHVDWEIFTVKNFTGCVGGED